MQPLIAPGRSVGQPHFLMPRPRVFTFLEYLTIFYLNRSIRCPRTINSTAAMEFETGAAPARSSFYNDSWFEAS
jgi:hypothetical protein